MRAELRKIARNVRVELRAELRQTWWRATPSIATSGVLIADAESGSCWDSPWHGLPSRPHVEFMYSPKETLCARSES